MATERDQAIDRALVQAALLSGDAAVAAWRSLPEDFELDEIWDRERSRLLATIGANLAAAGADDPALPRLRGVAKKQWAEHQMMTRRLLPLLDAIGSAGIEPAIVGGAGIGRASHGYDGQLGLRWADDTRVLIRPADAYGALSAIDGLVTLPTSARRDRKIAWRSSIPFRFDDGTWSLMMFRPSSTLTEWVAGRPVDVAGRAVSTLDPDSEMRAIADDVRWSPDRRGLSWLVDVDRLVRSGCCDVTTLRADPTVDAAVSLYEAALADEVGWWAECRREPGLRERFGKDLRSFGPGQPRWRRALGAGDFVADRWSLDRKRDVPRAAAFRVVRRIRRRVG